MAGINPRAALNGLPALAIRRPLLILVVNLLIALAGAAALMGVEVRELPDVDRPIVTVRGDFPGASPETVDAEVTSRVEGAVARVSGIRTIRSSSEENNFRVRLEFHPNVELDAAAADVREAVSRVERQLPEGVEQLTVIKADADASPIMRVVVASDSLPVEALTRRIENDIVPALISVPGVADVTLFGDRRRLLRVVIDPLRLTAHSLSVTDVSRVLMNAPFDVPAGSFRSQDQELIVRADATAVTPSQIGALRIGGGETRIRDVADVYFGPEDAESIVLLDGRQVIGLGVVRQARSNVIDISDGVSDAIDRINARFDDLELVITADDAAFIRGSVREVLITLGLAVVIVIATIWLFIGSPRATLIPTVSIPIALVGSVAAIWLMGFSINLLTLLGLVLATGMIVDDSIVVLENIQRRKAQGLASRAAAALGTRQVFFAILATTATLISVFVPISFLPSAAGRMFQEFGFVLAVAVAISSFVALSLAPALAARLPERPATQVRPLVAIGRGLARFYERSLGWALDAPLVAIAIALAFGALAGLAYLDLDEELLPEEDRGVLYLLATGPDGVGLTYSERQSDRLQEALEPYLESGEIVTTQTIVGRWDLNRVHVTAPLAPWDQRERGLTEIKSEIRRAVADIPGARVSVYSPNSLGLRGARGGVEIALIGDDYNHLFLAAQALSRAIEDRLPNLSNPEISYQPTQPQLSVRLDRRRAADLGLDLDEIAATLRAMIDGDELVDLNVGDESVPIVLGAASGAIDDPGDLSNLYVRSATGALVPLSSIAYLTEEGVAAELDRNRQRRSIDIDMDLAVGYALRDAIVDLQHLAEEVLPPGVELILMGEAAALDETSHDVAITYAIALLVVFLVLAAQFESLMSAAVVMATAPFGVAAAVFALYLTGTSINIYSQIGLLMLIGLMAKNGILVVEFADQLRDAGLSVRNAVATAAKVRLRPIAMTMISTVVGGLPLILSSGPGAESRAAIGWVVFGGLGIAAAFTLYLTPVAYLGLARFARPRAAEGARLERELEQAGDAADLDVQSDEAAEVAGGFSGGRAGAPAE